jgi:hypothetical protein
VRLRKRLSLFSWGKRLVRDEYREDNKLVEIIVVGGLKNVKIGFCWFCQREKWDLYSRWAFTFVIAPLQLFLQFCNFGALRRHSKVRSLFPTVSGPVMPVDSQKLGIAALVGPMNANRSSRYDKRNFVRNPVTRSVKQHPVCSRKSLRDLPKIRHNVCEYRHV